MNNLDFTLICLVTFFSKKRKTPPNLTNGKYNPHLVIKGDTEYLGVTFIDGEGIVNEVFQHISAKELKKRLLQINKK